MKKGFLLLFLALNSQVFAIQSTKNETFVFLDFLMWQVREVSDENWGQILGPAGTKQQIEFLDVPFKWKPGLRAGIGYVNQDKPWDVVFYYTGYKTKGLNQASVEAGEIHSSFAGNFYADNLEGAGISGPYYHQAGIRWNIVYNSLDLELGRSFTINSVLKLRPFTGLKAAVINQDINSIWRSPFKPTTISNPGPTPITTFSAATESITNNFKGAGPSFGLDTSWHLHETTAHNLNLLGNFSGAFLWGHWKLTDVYQNNSPITISVINDSLSTSAPMARGYLGLEWTTSFSDRDLNIRLGYEGQIWFGQLRYYSFDMGKLSNSLMIQGGVLDCSLHF